MRPVYAIGVVLAMRVAASMALIAVLIATQAWIGRRSRALGVLFATGLALRVVLAGALFLISLFGWPLFRHLQLGGGFWLLAIDGRTYYDLASRAAQGIESIADVAPSPFYLRVLAIW